MTTISNLFFLFAPISRASIRYWLSSRSIRSASSTLSIGSRYSPMAVPFGISVWAMRAPLFVPPICMFLTMACSFLPRVVVSVLLLFSLSLVSFSVLGFSGSGGFGGRVSVALPSSGWDGSGLWGGVVTRLVPAVVSSCFALCLFL